MEKLVFKMWTTKVDRQFKNNFTTLNITIPIWTCAPRPTTTNKNLKDSFLLDMNQSAGSGGILKMRRLPWIFYQFKVAASQMNRRLVGRSSGTHSEQLVYSVTQQPVRCLCPVVTAC